MDQTWRHGSWARYGLLGLAVLVGLYLSSLYSFLLFHSLIELFSVVVAAALFVLAWNTRHLVAQPYLLFIGIAYLFVAGLDLAHTLAYKGMGVFTGHDANLPTQLWIAARYLQAFSLLAAPFFLGRRFNVALALAAFAVVTGLLLGAIFFWKVFPDCFVEGQGLTSFKKNSEYVISTIILIAGALTWHRRRDFDRRVLLLMLFSLGATIVSELAFTFYVSVYGLSNLVGHFAKIAAFFLVYKAIVETGLREPIRLLFRDLKQREQELQHHRDHLQEMVDQRTSQLSQALENLRQEYTERERAEASLKSSEERYRVLVENASEAILLVQDGRCIMANPHAESLTGRSREELAATTMVDLVHPSQRALVSERYKKMMAGEEVPATYDIILVDNNGRETPAQVNATRIMWQGDFATLAFIRDLTETKKLEMRVRQAQKMEAIGCLAGGVAHDFNNILGVIIGNGELALENERHNVSTGDELEQIMLAANRAVDLVRQLMSFSRQQEVERQAVKVPPIIRETIKLLRSSLPTTIDIRSTLSQDAGNILADPTEIHQVLMNLCTNAFHAMREKGGVLAMSLDEVELDEDMAARMVGLRPGPHLRLTVADTGHGMDQETVSRIFDPFFTTKKEGEGTGLGLAVVHGIVKSMGGAITVYSEPGQGTTFHIYFPVLTGEARVQPHGEPGPLPRGQERILLVDDEKALVEVGQKVLERLGYQVTTQTSSKSALDLFRSRPQDFDLVLTDQTMPGITGTDLARHMLDIRPELPIILCTGFSEQVSAGNFRDSGFRSLLMKPLHSRQVATTIREVLDN